MLIFTEELSFHNCHCTYSEISNQTNISPKELEKTLKSLVDVKLFLSSKVSFIICLFDGIHGRTIPINKFLSMALLIISKFSILTFKVLIFIDAF